MKDPIDNPDLLKKIQDLEKRISDGTNTKQHLQVELTGHEAGEFELMLLLIDNPNRKAFVKSLFSVGLDEAKKMILDKIDKEFSDYSSDIDLKADVKVNMDLKNDEVANFDVDLDMGRYWKGKKRW